MNINSKPQDQDDLARTLALDPSQSFIVQAPAGSGKTHLLIQRFLGLLEGADSPEEILAITFTKKAAFEMRERLIVILESAVLSGAESSDQVGRVLNRDRLKNWQILQHPNRLRIKTIDSLNAEIVKRMPVMSRMIHGSAVHTDPELLYEEAIRGMLDILKINSYSESLDDVLKLMLHFENDFTRLSVFLKKMLSARDQWLPYLVGIAQNSAQAAVVRSWENFAQDIVLKLNRLISKDIIFEIKNLLQKSAAFFLQDQDLEDLNVHQKTILRASDCDVEDLTFWKGACVLLMTTGDAPHIRKRIDKSLGFPPEDRASKTILQQILLELEGDADIFNTLWLLQALPSITFDEKVTDLLSVLSRTLSLLTAHLKVLFQEKKAVDFQELGASALLALGDEQAPTDLALWFDYSIRHILVDEFQDTSYSQLQLLKLLSLGWQAGDGKTLFLVGDPMQSIYRFRQAEVSLFLEVQRHGLGSVLLKPLRISKNFRSQANIVHWVNHQFKMIFPPRDDFLFGAVSYSPSDATIDPITDSCVGSGVNICVFKEADSDHRHEARFALHKIQFLLSQGENSIAVLVRSRSHLAGLMVLLRENHIPIQAVEIERLSERMVIQDLLALTCAIVFLEDYLSWMALLRSPLCGLVLTDLECFADHCSRDNLLIWDLMQDSDFLNQLSQGGRDHILRIVPLLKNSLEYHQRIPLVQLIRETWCGLGGPAVLPTVQAIEDATQYFHIVSELEQCYTLMCAEDLSKKIAQLFSKTIAQTQGACVQLMTIHKSKGLQFDHVILPCLGQSARPMSDQLLQWQVYHQGDFRGILLAPYYPKIEPQGAFYDLLKSIEKEKQKYESQRLLYVAMTRAKRACWLTGIVSTTPKGEICAKRGSLLHLFLGSLAEGEYQVVDSQSIQTIQSLDTDQRLLYRLPLAWNAIQAMDGMLASGALLKKPEVCLPYVPSQNPSTYLLQDITSMQVGIVVHRLFCRLAAQGDGFLETASETLLRDPPRWRAVLLQMGVGLFAIEGAVHAVGQALRGLLADPIGLWMLKPHLEAVLEQVIVLPEGHTVVRYVIDRSFVDELGRRWVIDYKTGTEIEAGRLQLNRYAHCYQQLDSRPIHLGLYFPLTQSWITWEYGS
jgi:ATP-dependent exoDNAse (exonuclease V) beta subunit